MIINEYLNKRESNAPPIENEPKFFTFYVHNISGARTKINNINDRLHTSTYDGICLQETWFNASIASENIVNGTHFKIFRFDRSQSTNSAKEGGGVTTIIDNS